MHNIQTKIKIKEILGEYRNLIAPAQTCSPFVFSPLVKILIWS